MSWKQKDEDKAQRRRSKYTGDPEADRAFDELRRKYANAVVYLLAQNISQSNLRAYFYCTEDNKRRFETLKRFRQNIIDARPKAKQWVDKGFYYGIDLGSAVIGEDFVEKVPIILAGYMFNLTTKVVRSKQELDTYMGTIAKIIDSERIWSDPDMADFDLGEREDQGVQISKRQKRQCEQHPQQVSQAGEEEKEVDAEGDSVMGCEQPPADDIELPAIELNKSCLLSRRMTKPQPADKE